MADSSPIPTVLPLQTAYRRSNSRSGLDASPFVPSSEVRSTTPSLDFSMSTSSGEHRSSNPFSETPPAVTHQNSFIFTPQPPTSPSPSPRSIVDPDQTPPVSSLAEKFRNMEVAAKEKEKAKANRVIVLQVGERRFTVYRSTLTEKSLFFNNMLKDDWKKGLTTMSDGAIFVDRDGDLFADILAYLRSDNFPLFWSEKRGFDLVRYQKLHVEAQYFMIDRLEEWLEGKMWDQCVTTKVRSVDVSKEELLTSAGFKVDHIWSTGKMVIIPRMANKAIYVCPEGLEEHEGEPSLCARSCLVPSKPKPVSSAPSLRGKAVPARDAAGRGGLTGGAGSSRPVAARTSATQASNATEDWALDPYRKKEQEFVGVTLIQKEVEIDHGLLMGEESTNGKPRCGPHIYDIVSEDNDEDFRRQIYTYYPPRSGQWAADDGSGVDIW